MSLPTLRVDLSSKQPMVKILGYYDEEERAHIPETQRDVVDYLISSGQPIPVEDLQYDKGRLQCVQILDPRKHKGYIPVTLYVNDFKMEVFI